MAALALDLTPVVDVLLGKPFERATLQAANAAVGGNAQAYATALRCAAKRASDKLAAAYFLTEAARVHESVDDLGGELALLWRARENDRENPRTAELMAACMTRIAIRAGLSFSFKAPAIYESSSESGSYTPLETGLRPAAPDRPRDTLPELFGLDSPESSQRPRLDEVDTLSDGWGAASDSELPPPPAPRDSDPLVFALSASRRVEPMLPPVDPESPVTKASAPAPVPEPVLRAIADLALTERRPEVVIPLARAERPAPRSSEIRVVDDVYADEAAPKTVRPVGDQLVGALFESLHALHFLDDARSGAEFLARVLEEKMRASKILVHVHDINSRHFVVMSAISEKAVALSDYATPEDDPFIAELMREDEATLVLEPKDDPRLSRGRWLLAEPQRSLLCAPAALDGRYLGLVEIADPIDGSEFTEDDRNALSYAASAFARFLDKRGIVLSEEDSAAESASG